MRKIVVIGSGPTVGMDYCDVLGVYPEDIADCQILSEARDYALDYVSGYMEILAEEPDYDDWEHYVDYCYEEDIEYRFEEYNPEIHDMYKTGGGSFQEEFTRLCGN